MYKLSQPTTHEPLLFRFFGKKIVEAYEKRRHFYPKSSETLFGESRHGKATGQTVSINGETYLLVSVALKRKAFLSKHEEAVIDIVEAHPDLTLWQYSEKLREKAGHKMSVRP